MKRFGLQCEHLTIYTFLILFVIGSAAMAQESAFDKAYDPKTKTIRLNPDDPTGDLIFQKRDFSKDNRPVVIT